MGFMVQAEGSLQYKGAPLVAETEDFSKLLTGRNPFQIEEIWTFLYRKATWSGGALRMSAISAIDLALWDIKGKALGVPMFQLIGGKLRNAVPIYAYRWLEGLETEEEHVNAAVTTLAKGYTCLNFYPFIGNM